MLIALAQGAFLALLPSGGQQTARANAWRGMVAERATSRARSQAETSLDAAVRRAGVAAAVSAARLAHAR